MLRIKPGAMLLGSNDKMKANLRNKLSEVKMILIEEISMLLRDLFYKIHDRFTKILLCCNLETFAGISIVC